MARHGQEHYKPSTPLPTGSVIERGAFGKAADSTDKAAYMTYKDALEQVTRYYTGDPTNPEASFARDLRIEIIDRLADKLGLKNTNDYNKVRFYSARGSAFDLYHGVDGFVEVDIDGQTFRVTLDITTREKDTWKADILIVFPKDDLDPDMDEKMYLAMVDKVAEAVVKKLIDPSRPRKMVHHEDI